MCFGDDVEQWRPSLLRYARALKRNEDQAEDLVQQTMLRALQQADLFEPGTNLRAWLFTIMHNLHVNDVRRSVRQPRIADSSIEDYADRLSVSAVAPARIELADLRRMLKRLSPDQQEVLVFASQGLSYDQIAEKMVLPVGTVRSRLSRGRERLALLMAGSDVDADDLAMIESLR